MTPEQAAFLLTVQLPVVRNESAITARVFKAVPEGKDSYRPHPNSRSALELVWHIASVDLWFLDGFIAGNFAMEDDSMPADFSSSGDIIAWYEDEIGPKLDKVAKLPAEFWATPLPFFGIYNHPAVTYLQFMLLHTAHHRGQLCAYLRSMGGKVPSVYGGSFDEPMESPASK
ncbi:MAG: DinB family protein [Candidatus Acidiferrales bacterium]